MQGDPVTCNNIAPNPRTILIENLKIQANEIWRTNKIDLIFIVMYYMM